MEDYITIINISIILHITNFIQVWINAFELREQCDGMVTRQAVNNRAGQYYDITIMVFFINQILLWLRGDQEAILYTNTEV